MADAGNVDALRARAALGHDLCGLWCQQIGLFTAQQQGGAGDCIEQRPEFNILAAAELLSLFVDLCDAGVVAEFDLAIRRFAYGMHRQVPPLRIGVRAE